MPLIGGFRIELERYPDFGLGAELAGVETGSEDPDDRIRIAAQRYRFSDHARVAREAPFPEPLADQSDMRSLRDVFFRGKCAPANNRRAKQPEIVGAHLYRLELLEKCAPSKIHDTRAKRRNIVNHAGLFAVMLEFRR